MPRRMSRPTPAAVHRSHARTEAHRRHLLFPHVRRLDLPRDRHRSLHQGDDRPGDRATYAHEPRDRRAHDGPQPRPDRRQRDHAHRQGSQYFAKTYQRLLKRLDIRQSTSRTGSCLDGAAAESFFATIKSEIGTDSWIDRTSARRDIENYITDYNARRLHSAIDYQPPATLRLAGQTRMSTTA